MSEIQLRRASGEGQLAHDPRRREVLRNKIAKWLDPPLMLASILLLVLVVIQVTTPLPPRREAILIGVQTAIWVFFVASFAVELALAPDRLRFLRRHWLRALTVVIPVAGFLRVLGVFRFAHWLAYVRLLLLGHRTGSPALEILRRRHLGQVALMSVFVAGVAASVEYLVEPGAPGSDIQNVGDALWWAAATLTTIGSPLSPVTTGGKVVAVLLMLYAVSVFTYFVASLASVLIGHDESKEVDDGRNPVVITDEEAAVLRRIVRRIETSENS